MAILIHGLAMGTFLGLGYLFPRDKEQAFLNRDMFINIATGIGIFVVTFHAMAAVRANLEMHLFSLPLNAEWQQFLVAFVLLDLARYWLHYAHHRVPWLWRFHRVHHSAEQLDSTTGLRMHIFDFFQLAMIPILLFGVLIDTTSFTDWVIPAALAVGVFFDSFAHANLKHNFNNPFWRAWGKFLNNPHFHVWHHTRVAREFYGNFGNVLLIWDRMFGTVVTEPRLPDEIGISAEQALKNDPVSLQLLTLRS